MIEPITVSDLYNYPVTISDVDFRNYTGYDLQAVLENVDKSANVVQEFIDAVHSIVYDSLIYATGGKTLKDAMLAEYGESNSARLDNAVKRALLAQGVYMIENGDVSTWSGVSIGAGGQADVKDSRALLPKIVCPRTVEILLNCEPSLLYCGGDTL